MKILIGYSMRSGSTLLQHVLNQHSQVRSFSDLSSFWAWSKIVSGVPIKQVYCMKPMDLVFLGKRFPFYRRFDKLVWIARDPRDSYLSSLESGYAYLFWPKGRHEHGIDVGLLRRWKRVYRHYFRHEHRWYRVHYEALVTDPDTTLAALFDYLELEPEQLLPFSKYNTLNGGDRKLRHTRTVKNHSAGRHARELSPAQLAVFEKHLGPEMRRLGYLERVATSVQPTDAALDPRAV